MNGAEHIFLRFSVNHLQVTIEGLISLCLNPMNTSSIFLSLNNVTWQQLDEHNTRQHVSSHPVKDVTYKESKRLRNFWLSSPKYFLPVSKFRMGNMLIFFNFMK